MTTKTEIKWKIQTADLYEEPCDCGGQVRHNNGGNYHSIARLVTASDGEGNAAVVVENTTTREVFPGDDFDVLVFDGRSFGVIPEEWARERDGDEAIHRFLTAEAMVLYAIVGGEGQER